MQSVSGRSGGGSTTISVLVAVAVLVLSGAATGTAHADGWAQGGALTSAVANSTSPLGFRFGSGAARIYFQAAADGQIHELSYNPSSGWAQAGR